jgi:hypothetical protein
MMVIIRVIVCLRFHVFYGVGGDDVRTHTDTHTVHTRHESSGLVLLSSSSSAELRGHDRDISDVRIHFFFFNVFSSFLLSDIYIYIY